MILLRGALFALCVSLLSGAAGNAFADASFGPKVGLRAPDIGALPDQTDKVRKGVVRASLAEETYQKRPPVAEVVKALDAIK